MMNYYEEFGIPRDAPEAIIRQAYKRLARVLHPDAHPDEALKAVAEREMTRLNAMLDTLLDPAKRRAYDASLLEATHRRRLPPAEVGRGNSEAHRYQRLCWRLQVMKERAVLAAGTRRAGLRPALMRSAHRHWFWILTGLMMTGTGVWYVAAKDSAVVNGAAAETASQAENPRADSGGAGAETWAGNWVYASPPEDAADAGPTAPSYSELLLAEEHGKLTGIYRARYRIGNQALPPEVGFRVEGTAPSGPSARLVWASADGAKGEAELTLASSDVIKVAWWTTALGPPAALTSGTATLVRQRVR
jgi:curved DNA-binding protein CbpA